MQLSKISNKHHTYISAVFCYSLLKSDGFINRAVVVNEICKYSENANKNVCNMPSDIIELPEDNVLQRCGCVRVCICVIASRKRGETLL